MQRRQDRHKRGPVFHFVRGFVNFFRSYRKWSNKGFVAILLLAVALSMGLVLLFESFQGIPLTSQKKDAISQEANKTNQNTKDQEEEKTARIMANGDLLYHIPIYRSALKRRWDL